MSRTSTTGRTATRNNRTVTKQEFNSEAKQLQAEIDAAQRELDAVLHGDREGELDSATGSIMRSARKSESDPVSPESNPGGWRMGDAEDNTKTVERDDEEGEMGRTVMSEEDDDEQDPHGEPDYDDLPAGNLNAHTREEEDEEDEDDDDMMPSPANMHVVRLRRAYRSGDRKAFAKALKAIITSEPDSSTASGKAEDRVEDIPEWDEENVDDVAKAILRLARKSKGSKVRRSMPYHGGDAASESDQLLLALTRTVMKMNRKMSMIQQPIEDILQGLGVTKDLEQHVTQRKQRPIQSTDTALVVQEVLKSLVGAVGQPSASSVGKNDLGDPAENLGSVLKALAGDPLWNGGVNTGR